MSAGVIPLSRFYARASIKNIERRRSIYKRSLSSTSSIQNDIKYCVDLVQRRDYDAYICGLLVGSDKARMNYFTMRALNVEIGSALQDANTNDNSLGVQLRLQFWRDALDKVYDTSNEKFVFETPVLRALKFLQKSTSPSKIFLDRLVDARELDLDLSNAAASSDKITYTTVADMERYGELTASSLIYLTLEGAEVYHSREADVAASHIGQSLGIINILKGFIFRAARGELCIPRDLFTKYNVKATDITHHPIFQDDGKELQLSSSENLKNAVKDVAFIARNHLYRARNLQGNLSKEARLCMLQAVSALHYLDRLENADFDVFDKSLLEKQSSRNDIGHHLKLGRAWITGVF